MAVDAAHDLRCEREHGAKRPRAGEHPEAGIEIDCLGGVTVDVSTGLPRFSGDAAAVSGEGGVVEDFTVPPTLAGLERLGEGNSIPSDQEQILALIRSSLNLGTSASQP
jgi:hypothetical protein